MASRFLLPLGPGRTLLGRGDPFLDLHREVNRLFDDTFRGMGGEQGGALSAAPRMDIHETENTIEISAELPGCSPDDIDLSIEGDTLTIRGEKRRERKDEQAHVVERSYGSFQRSVQLPFEPNPDEVQADFEHGVLKVSVPRRQEPERTRRIRIGGTRSSKGDRQTIEGSATEAGSGSAIGQGWHEREREEQVQGAESTTAEEDESSRAPGAPS